jgi:pimeloyl-ACP methyl ester carboxylesterase
MMRARDGAVRRRILIVHGIHTNEWDSWMDYLVHAFRAAGWEASKWTYGYAHAVLTRWQNPKRAETLANMIEPGDIVLGHSNGGCLAWMAAELGAPMGGAILINPALDCDRVMAQHVPWVNLYPNRHDKAVPLASWFGFRDIAPHPWGAQGRDGLAVNDARYMQRFSDTPAEVKLDYLRLFAPAVHGHGDPGVLTHEALPYWKGIFIADAEARMRAPVPEFLKRAA